MGDMMFRDAKRRIVPQIVTENGYSVLSNGDMTGIDIGKYKLLVDKRGEVLPYQYFDVNELKFVSGFPPGNGFDGDLPIASTINHGIVKLSDTLIEASNEKAATTKLVSDVESKIMNKFKNKLDVKSYGAKGDNSTDDYQSINEMFRDTFKNTVYDISISSNRFFTKSAEIQPGVYRVKKPNLFSADYDFNRSQNLVIEGNGAVLVFQDFEGFAFINDNKMLNITFNNFNFVSINDEESERRGLFYSYAQGGAQDVKFNNCTFNGKWKNLVELQGTDNNSEWVWDKCSFYGQWDAALYIGENNTSDQFLNYWFDKCKYWTSSTWIRAHKGGHFKLDHCDVSGFEPGEETYLFELLGRTHGLSAPTFIDDGTRYELKNSNAKVLKCEWDNARLSFDNSDWSSNGFNVIKRESVFDIKNYSNGSLSNYSFTNCVILGKFILRSSNVSTLNNLHLNNCILLGDSETEKVSDIFLYNKSSNQSEFIKVNLKDVKFDNKLYNTVLENINSSHSFLKQNNFYRTNPYGNLDEAWLYDLNTEAVLDEIVTYTRSASNGNDYTFAIRSDTTAKVLSVNTSQKQVLLDKSVDILPGNKIVMGDSNEVYTVSSYNHRNKIVTLQENINNAIQVNEKVEFELDRITFSPLQNTVYSKKDMKYILKDKLYIKNLGLSFPSAGLPVRIIVKITE